MRKVLFVSNSRTGGGAERVTNLIANGLFGRGWDVTLVPVNQSDDDSVNMRVKVVEIDRQLKAGLWSTFKSIVSFNQAVRHIDPDLIVLNCELPEMLGAFLIPKRRIVVVEHTSFPWKNRQLLGKLVRKILIWKKSSWVVVSKHLGFPNVPSSRRHVIENPLSLGKPLFNTSAGDISRLFFVGRLSTEKNPQILLNIASSSGLPVTFVGDGILMEHLKLEAKKLNVKAIFHGRVVDPWTLIRAGDLLIVPSLYEGDGLVVLEAVYHRVPLLLSDNADFRRFKFPSPNYCQDVQEFLHRIKENTHFIEKLKISEVQRSQLIKSRDLENILDKWELLLKQVD